MSTKLTEEQKRLLLAYSEGELSGETEREARQLLERDVQAARWLDEQEAALTLVREGIGEPPATARVHWDATVSDRSRNHRLAWQLGGAAAALALAFLLAFSYRAADEAAPETARQESTTPEPAQVEAAALLEEVRALRREVADLRNEIEAQRAGSKVAEAVVRAEREHAAAMVLSAGRQFERRFGDDDAARERYQFVVNNYRDTRSAAEAQSLLDDLRTVHGI